MSRLQTIRYVNDDDYATKETPKGCVIRTYDYDLDVVNGYPTKETPKEGE